MKIKRDFITNSSSTAYVVCVPQNKDFYKQIIPKLDDEELKEKRPDLKLLEEDITEELNLSREEGIEYIKSMIKKLQNGNVVSAYDNDTHNCTVYLLGSLLVDYVLFEYDTGEGEGGWMQTIKIDNLKTIIERVEGK